MLHHLGPGFHHYRKFKPDAAAGDYSKLRYWGLMAPGVNDDPKKKAAGTWSMTQRGIDWVMERIQIPRAQYVFDNKQFGHSDDTVGIREILHGKDGEPPEGFDYPKLMRFLI